MAHNSEEEGTAIGEALFGIVNPGGRLTARTGAPQMSGAAITVSVDVRNTGTRAGDEVVQLYVKHLDSRVSRPNKQLVGFQRVTLAAGSKTTVEMWSKRESVAYWDESQSRWAVEPDKIKVMAGGSSADIKLEKTLPVSGSPE